MASENMQRLKGITNLKFGTSRIYHTIWNRIYEKNFKLKHFGKRHDEVKKKRKRSKALKKEKHL